MRPSFNCFSLALLLTVFGALPAGLQAQTSGLPYNPYSGERKGGDILGKLELSGEDTGLETVAQQLELITGRTILRTQAFPKVSVVFKSKERPTRDEMMLALESLLSLNGIALISMGEYIKAVPAQNLTAQAAEMIEGSTLEYAPSLKYFTKVFDFKYLDAQKEAQPMLQPLFSSNQGFIQFTKANSVIITDTLMSLQRIELVLLKADTPRMDDVEILYFSLKHIDAQTMSEQLQSLLLRGNTPLVKYFQNNTHIEADERSNQILVVTHPSNVERIREMVARMDIDIEPKTAHRAFPIKHAVASEVVTVLNDLIEGQKKAAEQSSGNNRRKTRNSSSASTPPAEGQQPAATVSPATGSTSSSEGNLSFSEYVNVVHDERSNAIFATGSKADLDTLEKLIAEIDVELPQVRIEVVIADVTLTGNQASGMESFGLDYSSDDGLVFSDLKFGGSGLSIDQVDVPVDAESLSKFDISTVIGVAKSNANVQILSAPVIMTTHNKEARINVSTQRPLITGSSTTTGGTTTQNIDFRDVGIQLTVTPLIGENGLVQLEIEQTVDDFGDSDVEIDGNDQPIILKREASSFVSVKDGEIIVLGGLQRRNKSKTQSKLFLLGDIPWVGEFFSPESESIETSELILFIKPTILNRSKANADVVEEAIQNLPEVSIPVRDYLEFGRMPESEMEEHDPLKVKEVLGVKDEEKGKWKSIMDKPAETGETPEPPASPAKIHSRSRR